MTNISEGSTGFDRAYNMRTRPISVAIIGAGAGGMCMAIKLREAGITDFTIFEKAASVGGTWRDNTYPGSGCDVPSFLYSYSFEPKFDWTHHFAKQPEIEAYFKHVAEKYELLPHIRFNTEIESAAFDQATGKWNITTKSGETHSAHILVSGTGQLNRPAYPDIPGRDDFKGTVFHSARWNHDYDLTDKRVAVIGSGASAIQFVPEIVPKVQHLALFQRTPNWVVPKKDNKYSETAKSLFRQFPFLARLHRAMIYLTLERNWLAFRRPGSFFNNAFRKAAMGEIETYIKDPAMRARLTPDYAPGCKRVLISNDWYPAIARPNVEVITDGIKGITADGVETTDGTKHDVDAIIYATGFESTTFLAPIHVTGLNGVDLNQAWAGGAEAHRGIAVAGFPNFFMLYGPNTNLGHNSIIFMIEAQVRYILKLIEGLSNARISYLDVRPEIMKAFNKELQEDISKTVWASGCNSWYRTDDGKITNNWSGSTLRFWWQMREPDFDEYRLVG